MAEFFLVDTFKHINRIAHCIRCTYSVGYWMMINHVYIFQYVKALTMLNSMTLILK